MLIAITRKTGAVTEGCAFDDGTKSISASNLRIVGQSANQIAQGCRWTDVDTYDRDNETTTITFTCTRVFSALLDAEKFMLEQKASLRGEWDVILAAGGSKNALRWIKGAVVNPISMTNIGQTVFTEVSITGGRIRTSFNDKD